MVEVAASAGARAASEVVEVVAEEAACRQAGVGYPSLADRLGAHRQLRAGAKVAVNEAKVSHWPCWST